MVARPLKMILHKIVAQYYTYCNNETPEMSSHDISGVCLFLGCADFAPRVGARAGYRAREGIGGSHTKPTVQTKSAGDARLAADRKGGGDRRGAS